MASIDLQSGVVQQLGPQIDGAGNHYASASGLAFTAGHRLYLLAW